MNKITPGAYQITCFALCIIIFIIDSLTPLGVAGGVPYILVILITIYIPGKKSTLVYTLIASLLTLAGLYTSPPGGEQWQVITNRLLALFAICSTAFVIILRKKATEELISINNQLDDIIAQRTSELHEAQDKLIETHRLAVLGQLTATVSHELRNPLSVISASSYLLQSRLRDKDDNIREYLKRIELNIHNCDHIIDELSDFTSNQTINLKEENIDQLVQSAVNDYELPVQIEIHCEYNLANKILEVDASKIKRAITKALDNAVQAIQSADKQAETSRISIRTASDNNQVAIDIEDNGTGISDENMKKIFEPLFSTRSFGVGLGMPIIQKIMQQHQGHVEVETRPGYGTRIRFILPDSTPPR